MMRFTAGLAAAAAAAMAMAARPGPMPVSGDLGPIMIPCGVGFGGPGPIHRRGRFKPNQRKQRRGRK